MRIACPSCAAEYDVPAARLPPNKTVRCARCGGKWKPTLRVPETNFVEEFADEPDPRLPPVEEQHAEPIVAPRSATSRFALPPRPDIMLGGAWVLTAVMLLGAVISTVVWREQVMRGWPPSGRILAPFGHILPEPAHTEGAKPK